MLGVLSLPVRFRLEEALDESEMSQTELARLSGVSLVTVNALTRNRTRQVALDTIDKLCKVLKCEPGDLLTRKPLRRPSSP